MKLKILQIVLGLFFIVNALAEDRMLFAIDIIRHGDRTPTNEIPNDPHKWSEGLGELTAIGMNQEYKLGNAFYSMYINKLLPEHYSAKSIYVRSSDYNRTLMSAEAVLLGLYPMGSGAALPKEKEYALPNAFQPIPVHTTAENNDDLFISYKTPQFRKVVNDIVTISKEWQEKNKQYKSKFAIWSKATGLDIKDLEQIIALGDNLKIRKLNGVVLPKGINEVDAKEIMELADWAMITIYKSYPVARIGVGKILNTIGNYLQNASSGNLPLKYVLFSGHDTTIMSLLSSLHAPLHYVPNYASDLKFILFEKEENNYYVQISLNGKNVKIPSCHQLNCSLEEFIQATTN